MATNKLDTISKRLSANNAEAALKLAESNTNNYIRLTQNDLDIQNLSRRKVSANLDKVMSAGSKIVTAVVNEKSESKKRELSNRLNSINDSFRANLATGKFDLLDKSDSQLFKNLLNKSYNEALSESGLNNAANNKISSRYKKSMLDYYVNKTVSAMHASTISTNRNYLKTQSRAVAISEVLTTKEGKEAYNSLVKTHGQLNTDTLVSSIKQSQVNIALSYTSPYTKEQTFTILKNNGYKEDLIEEIWNKNQIRKTDSLGLRDPNPTSGSADDATIKRLVREKGISSNGSNVDIEKARTGAIVEIKKDPNLTNVEKDIRIAKVKIAAKSLESYIKKEGVITYIADFEGIKAGNINTVQEFANVANRVTKLNQQVPNEGKVLSNDLVNAIREGDRGSINFTTALLKVENLDGRVVEAINKQLSGIPNPLIISEHITLDQKEAQERYIKNNPKKFSSGSISKFEDLETFTLKAFNPILGTFDFISPRGTYPFSSDVLDSAKATNLAIDLYKSDASFKEIMDYNYNELVKSAKTEKEIESITIKQVLQRSNLKIINRYTGYIGTTATSTTFGTRNPDESLYDEKTGLRLYNNARNELIRQAKISGLESDVTEAYRTTENSSSEWTYEAIGGDRYIVKDKNGNSIKGDGVNPLIVSSSIDTETPEVKRGFIDSVGDIANSIWEYLS